MSLHLKKALSILLAVVMAFGVFTVCGFAETADEQPVYEIPALQNGEITPTIIVPGISQSVSVYCDENGNPIKDKNGKKVTVNKGNSYIGVVNKGETVFA